LDDSSVDRCYHYYLCRHKKEIGVDSINKTLIAPRIALLKCLRLSFLFAVVWPYNVACASDWIGIPLSKLIGTSDLIVYGSVKEVLDSTILFQVLDKIGDGKADVIEVLKAKPDPFADVKPAPPHVGQSYLLFLIKAPEASVKPIWKVMGKAYEAQMPVIDNYVYFIDRYFEGIPLQRYNVNGVELNTQRFQFPSFFNALQEYRKCYHWVRQGLDNRYLPKKLCDNNQLKLLSGKSFIHSYLVNETEAFITGK
jgi:hypothetical protein